MLPLPSSSTSGSRRNRIYFPSNPSPSSSQSIIGHLRSRTRLTNLAVGLILLLTASSLVLNLSTYLSEPTPTFVRTSYSSSSTSNSNSESDYSGWTEKGSGYGGGGGGGFGSEGIRSIEVTIQRDPRMEKLDHMVMVPGHAIWIGHDPTRVEDDEDWVLEPMQKGGSVRTFIRHLEEGVRVMKEDPGALLVFSG